MKVRLGSSHRHTGRISWATLQLEAYAGQARFGFWSADSHPRKPCSRRPTPSGFHSCKVCGHQGQRLRYCSWPKVDCLSNAWERLARGRLCLNSLCWLSCWKKSRSCLPAFWIQTIKHRLESPRRMPLMWCLLWSYQDWQLQPDYWQPFTHLLSGSWAISLSCVPSLYLCVALQ